MRRNLMGFKKVTGEVPPKSRRSKSKYDDLINVVRNTGDTYCFDFKNAGKARSVMTAIRHRLKTGDIHDVRSMVRGTSVYVVKEDSDD